MSSKGPIDLSSIPAPTVVEPLDFETIYQSSFLHLLDQIAQWYCNKPNKTRSNTPSPCAASAATSPYPEFTRNCMLLVYSA